MTTLITADVNTIPEIDKNNIHEWIIDHSEWAVYHTTVDNGVHAGYEIRRKANNRKVGEVYSPFTYHWSAIFCAPDGKQYSLMNNDFPGKHPSIKAFESLHYHDRIWGLKKPYKVDDIVWVNINGHYFTKRVVTEEGGIVTHVVNPIVSYSQLLRVKWDDKDKFCYVLR